MSGLNDAATVVKERERSFGLRSIALVLVAAGFAPVAATAWAESVPSFAAPACELCLYGPDNMAFDADGDVYLVDTDHKSRSRVLKLSPGGKVLAEWSGFPATAGRRNGPEGLAIDHRGRVFATDAGSSRVVELLASGARRTALPTDGAFADLGHLAIDQEGQFYVSEAAGNVVHKFSPAGKLVANWSRARGAGLEAWSNPETIAALGDGRIVLEDWGNRRIEILSLVGRTLVTFGGPGTGAGKFANTAGLGVDRHDNIYVIDDKLRRIQKFDTHGELLSVFENTPAGLYSRTCRAPSPWTAMETSLCPTPSAWPRTRRREQCWRAGGSA